MLIKFDKCAGVCIEPCKGIVEMVHDGLDNAHALLCCVKSCNIELHDEM